MVCDERRVARKSGLGKKRVKLWLVKLY